MQLELSRNELVALVGRQIENLFGFRQEKEREALSVSVDAALERCEFCFSRTRNKYYSRDGAPYFNPFHSGQYSIFLYFLSNSVFRLYPAARTLADRVYYLNKALNGLDLFYEVDMPRVFFLDHPIGSVLGRATYGESFAFAQNCTVGNNKGVYPVIGQNVRMMAYSMILGACQIGDNVILSARSYVKDTDIPSCSVVFGAHPNLVVKARDESYFKAS
jgi:serine O-acetyltransferase